MRLGVLLPIGEGMITSGYPYSPDGRMPSAPGAYPLPDPLELLAYVAR